MSESSERDLPALRAALLQALGDRQDLYPKAIEAHFPHILEQLATLWGKPAMDEYLDSLTFSNRPSRQGFPPEVATELFRLSELHQKFGFRPPGPSTGWNWIAALDPEHRQQ